jgi:HK97 family phage portal protein
MGAICRLLENGMSKRFNLKAPPQWFVEWVSGGASSSGISVSENKALKYTPFWAAVRIISGTLAALPFMVYSRLDNGGKDKQQKHPVYRLLHDRPNEYMDAITFQETRQAHVLCYGNGYAEIQRNGAGKPIALWPLLPDKTTRKIKDNIPYYEIQLPNGGFVYLSDENVLHIKGLGFDGYTGYNVVHYHKEAIGYGIGVKEYGSRFFGNDASPGGVLEIPNALSDKAFNRLKKSWKTNQGGLSNAHRIQILEEGMKFNKVGVDPAQAQALEVQKWTVDDCSRIFQIPPHKLGSMEFSKYNNVEQLQLDFVATTMLYWFRKWEQECDYKLFMPSEQGKLFCEILVDGLLRSDLKTRYMAYNIGRNAGFLCVDDIREKENMNPLPDGKGQIFLQPLNMIEVGTEQPKVESDNEDENIREAYRKLFIVQWQRIIKKQLKATKKNNDFDFSNHRDWCSEVLTAPVNVWAAHNELSNFEAKKRLRSVINLNINERRNFNMSDAEKMADLTMERIGGNHYAAT